MFKALSFLVGTVFSFLFVTMFVVFNFAPHQELVTHSLAVPGIDTKGHKAHYSMADLNCLRDNIFYEARNQSDLGKQLVGIVTIERTKTPGFPSSICDVVYETSQFSWTIKHSKVNYNKKAEYDAWIKCTLLARQLLANTKDLDEVYKGLAYYHATSVHPRWAKSMNKEFVVDDHVFYSKVDDAAYSFVLR